jgi:hypothetical protein
MVELARAPRNGANPPPRGGLAAPEPAPSEKTGLAFTDQRRRYSTRRARITPTAKLAQGELIKAIERFDTRTDLGERRSEEWRAARAVGITISLAAMLVLCWAALLALAIAGTIGVVTAILTAVGSYVGLTLVLWGLAGRG